MSFAKMEPAPSKSESELDIVAEIIPEKSNPQISAGIVRMASTGRAYLAPTDSNWAASNLPMLIKARVIIPKMVGINA